MHELILSAIVNMSATFAGCIIASVCAVGVVVVVFRTTRSNEAFLRGKEDARAREMNQINASLADLRQNQTHRIAYLEGKVAHTKGD
jgi:uncharacterized membrane protein